MGPTVPFVLAELSAADLALVVVTVCSVLAVIAVLVALAKGFESMSDVVYGLEQVHHRLDLTTRSLCLRGVAGMLAHEAHSRVTRATRIPRF